LFGDASAAEIGGWLLAAAGVIAIIGGAFFAFNQAKAALFPPKKRRLPGERYVTHADMAELKISTQTSMVELKNGLAAEIAKMKPDAYATKEELRETRSELRMAVKDLSEETRERFHRLNDAVHVQGLKLTAIMVKMGIDGASNLPAPPTE
jgi:hypothetical protein